MAAWRGEFQGIGKQVVQNLAQELRVGVDAEIPRFQGPREGHVVFRPVGTHFQDTALDEFRQGHRHGAELLAPGLETRQVQQVVDERQQVVAAFRGVVDAAQLFVRQRASVASFQELAGVEDDRQGCP